MAMRERQGNACAGLFQSLLRRLGAMRVARVERSETRGGNRAAPGFAALYPGYLGESALQQRFDSLVEHIETRIACDLLAVDEEGRRRIDLQHVAGVFLIGRDLVEQRLI